jgi:hypothetical protein
MRVQAGLVAYSLIFLSGRAMVDSYLRPGSLRPLAEPIRLWAAFGGGAAAPIDPTRLYVGNVPGPRFRLLSCAGISATTSTPARPGS